MDDNNQKKIHVDIREKVVKAKDSSAIAFANIYGEKALKTQRRKRHLRSKSFWSEWCNVRTTREQRKKRARSSTNGHSRECEGEMKPSSTNSTPSSANFFTENES
ncbi:hypothetical protein SESBI_41224 [Sesbania bispinosa]|nr:hypothetical protein SESBI_41224 [Sesbania bispinosa]